MSEIGNYRPETEQLANTEVAIGAAALLILVSPVAAIRMMENRTVEGALEPETLIQELENETQLARYA